MVHSILSLANKQNFSNTTTTNIPSDANEFPQSLYVVGSIVCLAVCCALLIGACHYEKKEKSSDNKGKLFVDNNFYSKANKPNDGEIEEKEGYHARPIII